MILDWFVRTCAQIVPCCPLTTQEEQLSETVPDAKLGLHDHWDIYNCTDSCNSEIEFKFSDEMRIFNIRTSVAKNTCHAYNFEIISFQNSG